ncbi:hypothetical protein [Streptomyces sp. MMG1121]|uniref:hypothetical protein n=1 Tax=Streptomyces sp. MMG1121 TaxID=1415544 RepID=UPI000AFC2EAE
MLRPDGLARAALRFKPSAFTGTFTALALAATIITACGILLETGARAEVPPHRYAHAPVVAAADQRVHLGRDGDNQPVPDRASSTPASSPRQPRPPAPAPPYPTSPSRPEPRREGGPTPPTTGPPPPSPANASPRAAPPPLP